MAGENPGGISRSNIGITWGHGRSINPPVTRRGVLGIVGKTHQTYNFLPPCQEIDISRHKLSQNDNFVSKYQSSVAAILKPHFQDHVTPIFQPTPILHLGP